MRKLLFSVMMMLASITSQAQNTLLCDCNGDGQVTIADAAMVVDVILNGYAPFNVSPTQITMSVGGNANLSIIGGYNLYEVISANPDVVVASLNGTAITLTAVSGGETTITVKDVKTFRYIEVSVKVNYNSLEISSSELSLVAGDNGTVDITSGSGSYSVQSSDTNVVTAKVTNGKVNVTGIGAGTATITVTDTKTSQTAVIEVTVTAPASYLTCPDKNHPHMIDLGLPSGTKWACCNVDTDHPENQSPTNYGGYYSWGEMETKSTYGWSNYIHCDGTESTCHNLGEDISSTQYDVAHEKWRGKWVMPTVDQIDELLSNSTSEWTTLNNVKGRKFTANNGGSVFFPGVGGRWDSSLSGAGFGGYYWSSTLESPSSDAYILFFNWEEVRRADNSRCAGFAVRPVAK